MPLYEYVCDRCGKILEVLQKYSDQPLTVHENCGGALEKLISRSAFQLKGSGWYATDYARGGAKPEHSSNGSAESKADAKADARAEAKSNAKSESKGDAKSDSKREAKSESKTETKTESKSESKPSPSSSDKTP